MKIRYDSKFVNNNGCNIPYLFPLLTTKIEQKLNYYHDEQIKKRLEVGNNIIENSSMKECDYVIFPKNYSVKYLKIIKRLCKKAKKYNKKVIAFYMSDVENRLPYIDNLIVFRPSLNNQNPNNEYSIPWFPEDLLKYNKKPYQNINTTKPTIGYTGYYAYYNLKTKIRYYIYKIAMYIFRVPPINSLIFIIFNYIYHNDRLYSSLSVIGTWWVCRKKAIDTLLQETRVNFNFIRREKWLWFYEDSNQRKEYIDNLINSDFPLVIRWFWNFSFRLSEVISLWKIPIFIDTDCKLPFENEINYKDLFIWVPYSDIKNTYKYIEKYIKKNKNNIINIEKKIRTIYEEYYTLTGYYTKISWLLKSLI